jgi:hypothetical protein
MLPAMANTQLSSLLKGKTPVGIPLASIGKKPVDQNERTVPTGSSRLAFPMNENWPEEDIP